MVSRKFGLFISLFGFLIALAGIIIDSNTDIFNWFSLLKLCGVLMLITGSLISYFSSQPYSYEFDVKDWNSENNGSQIIIPYRKHKKTNPTCKVFQKNNKGFEEVITDIQVNLQDVIVNINGNGFTGKLVIK